MNRGQLGGLPREMRAQSDIYCILLYTHNRLVFSINYWPEGRIKYNKKKATRNGYCCLPAAYIITITAESVRRRLNRVVIYGRLV